MGALPGAPLEDASARIFVAGHRGLLGSAVARELAAAGFRNVLCRTRAELDLRDAAAVERLFSAEPPEYVVLAAARVGGIGAMRAEPFSFLSENLAIQSAVMEAARRQGVARLLFIASSAMYPGECPQPIREEYLLTGTPEESVRPYALAKLAGVEFCRASNAQFGTRFLAVAPPNLYGPGDRFDPASAGVLGALLSKAHRAVMAGEPEIEIWGTGSARREFLFAEDLARACVRLLTLDSSRYDGLLPLVNVGAGEDVSIRELAEVVARVTGFRGRLRFDASKPEGTLRKLLDSTRMAGVGWRPEVRLEEGIARTYEAVRERL